MSWIDLNHSPLEWAVFIAAIAGLILVKIYAKRELRQQQRRDRIDH